MSRDGWHPSKLLTSSYAQEVGTSGSSYREPVRENKSLPVKSFFVSEGEWDDDIEWERRSAEIVNPVTGEKVFEADELEFPKDWSQNCTAIVGEKYLRNVERHDGTKVRETSVKQMIDRVAGTISEWGKSLGYFDLRMSMKFYQELAYILSHQLAAFNSPVWFNVGTKMGRIGEEQCSACFINSIEDDMQSILSVGITEGTLYKHGSGSGINYSNLRSSKEGLSGGGFAGGPVPFIMKDDFNAGAIQSGGTTRRAAKMAILNIDHPDILEFIQCKAKGEAAAHALIDSGAFTGDFRDRWGAYKMVPFQNANHSVRVTDAFMEAVDSLPGTWELKAKDGTVVEKLSARELWDAICESAHFCGDPGIQFDTTVNKWHTSPAEGRINASNPCSEYMFLDDSACNLASINLLKFLDNREIQIDALRHTIDTMTTAMEIIVGSAGYPTEKIAKNSHKYRPLGLGFSNLGAYLMAQGMPYDSDVGRHQAGMLTAIITGRAYAKSAEIAEHMGPFEGYSANKASMLSVMEKHASHVKVLDDDFTPLNIKLTEHAREDWTRCLDLGKKHGYRNAQASVIAPAGTISFMMDCDTTGIEPDLSLKKTKKLVGGGTIQIVNNQVRRALSALGYDPRTAERIEEYVQENGSVVGCHLVEDKHHCVFDTSFPDPVGGRFIAPRAHVDMMAAVQPFVSGAISKTVNMPAESTPEDIGEIYMEAWKQGLKAVAIYRDGCKRTQPLSSSAKEVESDVAPTPLQLRRKLPNDCLSQRHRFQIGGHSGYLHVGLYPDGKPGELFLRMAKEGSTVSGLMDTIGVLTSIALQYGVPLEVLVDKFSFTNFEPSGITNNEDVRFAKSPVDYIFRFLGSQFLKEEKEEAVFESSPRSKPPSEGTVCGNCGNGLQRAGACLSCSTCGWSEGCG